MSCVWLFHFPAHSSLWVENHRVGDSRPLACTVPVVCSGHGWFFGAFPGLRVPDSTHVRTQAFTPPGPPPPAVRSGGDALQGSGTGGGRRFAGVILVLAGRGVAGVPTSVSRVAQGQQPRTTLACFGPPPTGRDVGNGGTEGVQRELDGADGGFGALTVKALASLRQAI